MGLGDMLRDFKDSILEIFMFYNSKEEALFHHYLAQASGKDLPPHPIKDAIPILFNWNLLQKLKWELWVQTTSLEIKVAIHDKVPDLTTVDGVVRLFKLGKTAEELVRDDDKQLFHQLVLISSELWDRKGWQYSEDTSSLEDTLSTGQGSCQNFSLTMAPIIEAITGLPVYGGLWQDKDSKAHIALYIPSGESSGFLIETTHPGAVLPTSGIEDALNVYGKHHPFPTLAKEPVTISPEVIGFSAYNHQFWNPRGRYHKTVSVKKGALIMTEYLMRKEIEKIMQERETAAHQTSQH